MGFDDGQILLNRSGSFNTGETIHGKLVFDQDKPKTFRGLYVQFKGTCDVHWTTSHSRTVDGKTEHYTVDHNSHETYFKQRVYLMGSDHGEVLLQPGHHEFPFQFLVPQNCPTSFRGNYGSIEYVIKCVVDRSMKFDQEKKIYIDIVALRDLNADPYCREPITFQFHESYCCWCMSSGICDVEVKLPASGYIPGQTIHIEVNCTNKSSVEVDSIKLELKEETTFNATSNPDTKTENDTIAKIKKGPIPANTTRNWTVEMEIPQIDVRNIDACSYIHVDYEFKVKLSVSGCHSDAGDSTRVVIGHIPLREFEGPEQNVHVQSPTAIPFPSNPYPGANAPYPGANAPYPQVNPTEKMNPLPMVSPYPQNIPVGPPNVPYPGVNPPYPGVNPPYPGANPQHHTNPLYPGANPPYPTGPSPIPNPTPSSIGFNVSLGNTNGPNEPLLPHAPYATNTSPYTNASAP